MFEEMMKKNKSIMDAYQAVADKTKQCAVEEEDTGGDGSAYNKYLPGKTGDLPRTKAEYIAAGESESK